MKEFCKLPAHILLREAVIVSEEIDIGEVSERMFKEDVEEFIVARDNEIIGIVSKRDLVYGFVVLSKQ
jgi:CBS domain-containing protein